MQCARRDECKLGNQYLFQLSSLFTTVEVKLESTRSYFEEIAAFSQLQQNWLARSIIWLDDAGTTTLLPLAIVGSTLKS